MGRSIGFVPKRSRSVVGFVSTAVGVSVGWEVGSGDAGENLNINDWLVGAQVGVSVGEGSLSDDWLFVVGNGLNLSSEGLVSVNIVVSSSLAGALDGSWDLADNVVVFLLEGLDVDGLVNLLGAVVSDGLNGVGWCGFLASNGDVLLSGVSFLANAVRINLLGLVDEDGSWDLVGGGGWDVDGLCVWLGLGVVLDSGNLSFLLFGASEVNGDKVVFGD